MKTLYEASNTLEAHMLRSLLKQENIISFLEGEYLQSGIGVFPANGLVRLVVDEKDYLEARAVIERWENAAPPEEDAVTANTIPPKQNMLKGVLIGFAIGLAVSYAFFKVPTYGQGIDHNRDGMVDEKWTYSIGGLLLKYEADRNFDKKIDMLVSYDNRGATQSNESDDDFNGTFETRTRYRLGNAELSEIDTNGDGSPDLIYFYTNGVLFSNKYINPSTGRPARIEYYKLGKLTKAEADTDKDGVLDSLYVYGELGEIVSIEMIKK